MTKRKLPYQQLAILALCRVAEPIAMSSIFPYLPEMIEFFGIREAEVAKWVGLTSAIFSLCQSCTGVLWGRLSDWIGRKPVVLICLVNTMVTALVWGFSVNLPMAIIARALSGAGNGNVGILRTIVAELCPWKELQPRAFSVMPMVWIIGSIIGPAMGGALSNPLNVEPGQRGDKLLERFPFLLPNIVSAVIFTCGIIIGLLFLRETLASRKDRPDVGIIAGRKLIRAGSKILNRFRRYDPETEPLLKDNNHHRRTISCRTLRSASQDPETGRGRTEPKLSAPGFREVLTNQSILNLIVYMILALYMIGYDQVLTVFMHHKLKPNDSPDNHLPFFFGGGFGIKSARIGILFTVYGIFNIFCQFLIFPVMTARLGPLRTLRLATALTPVIFFLTPFTSLLAPNLQQPAMIVLMTLKGFCNVVSFPASTILLTNSASSLRVLGTLNGWATSVSALGRAAGPGIGGGLFTIGARHNCVGLPFWVLGAFAAINNIPLYFLIEGRGFGDDPEEEPAPPEQRDAVVERGGVVDPQTLAHDSYDEEAGTEGADALTPLLSRTTSAASRHSNYGNRHPNPRSSSAGPLRRQVQDDDLDSDDESSSSSDFDAVDVHGRPMLKRKSSVPIGMGSGFRRLSSNLGQTRSGYGAGAWGD